MHAERLKKNGDAMTEIFDIFTIFHENHFLAGRLSCAATFSHDSYLFVEPKYPIIIIVKNKIKMLSTLRDPIPFRFTLSSVNKSRISLTVFKITDLKCVPLHLEKKGKFRKT